MSTSPGTRIKPGYERRNKVERENLAILHLFKNTPKILPDLATLDVENVHPLHFLAKMGVGAGGTPLINLENRILCRAGMKRWDIKCLVPARSSSIRALKASSSPLFPLFSTLRFFLEGAEDSPTRRKKRARTTREIKRIKASCWTKKHGQSRTCGEPCIYSTLLSRMSA